MLSSAKGILKQYLDLHQVYGTKYGPQTVILMMVGSFYEIYAVINEEMNVGPDIYGLSEILRVQVTRKTKQIPEVSYENPLLTGVPLDYFHKYCTLLMKQGYTVVQVDQVTSPPNPERKVVEVHSRGTSVEGSLGMDTTFLASVYLEVCLLANHRRLVSVGLSAIDVGTGANYVHRIAPTPYEEDIWNDEIYRLLHSYQPCELLIHYEESLLIPVSELCQRWAYPLERTHVNHVTSPRFRSPSYQNEFYRKIYPDCGFLTPLETMGMERFSELILSHIYMLEYIYEHNMETITELPKPHWIESETHLSLSHNAMYQLNLLETTDTTSPYRSLLTLLNTCQTSGGRRLFKRRLLNPILDPQELEHRYAQIEVFQGRTADNTYLYERCRHPLKHIRDLERLSRRMSLGLLHPYEFYSLHQSFGYLWKLVTEIRSVIPDYLTGSQSMLDNLQTFQEYYEGIFQLPETEKYSLDAMKTSVFVKGVEPEIDKIQEDLQESHRYLRCIARTLDDYIDAKKPGSVKLTETDRYGWALCMTAKRATTLKNRLRNLTIQSLLLKEGPTYPPCDIPELIQSLKTRGQGKDIYVTMPLIETISQTIVSLQKQLGALNQERYLAYLRILYRDHGSLLDATATFVSLLDLNVNVSKSAKESIYCRPQVHTGERSALVAQGLRHPLVEKIQIDVAYVPNDISLDQSGILLYGTNACGKSTLMKSLGMAVVMAQAGFFVPCSSFTFTPYTQIFTRILSNDNLFQGQSTFATEMSELRGILKRANERSLVLGDELCSGTEHTSAISIVSAGLKTFSDLRTSFIFTSHLHDLPQISLVKDLPNLTIYHLKIDYDSDTDCLIYDRTLMPGPGPPIYGLRVAQAMDLGHPFLALARQVQMEIMGEPPTFVNAKTSPYHKDLVMDRCHVCQKSAQEAHHIAEQHTANEDQQIGHFHKDAKHNLVPLCTDCHHEVHHGTLRIHGYQQTDQGILLHHEWIAKPTQTPKINKLTQTEIQLVLTHKDAIRTKTLSKSQCLRNLELNHQLTLSPYTLNKLLNGTD
jgi:DNA mismatch repair protein MutS